jgi:hypothetical protein
MSSIIQVPLTATVTAVQDVSVAYDEANDGVTVTPGQIGKGATVRFSDPKGGRLRIEFLLPNGQETTPVLDSEFYILEIGGIYHFKCFFLPKGASVEISPKNGGILDVVPERP